MNKKVLALVILVCILIGLVTGYFLPKISSNPSQSRIACYAVEQGTSVYYKDAHSPVVGNIGQYFTGNITEPDTVNLGINVTNNYYQALFNINVEVSYKTSNNEWNTDKTTISFLDIYASEHIQITLQNPYLSTWQAPSTVNGQSENITVYVLDASNYKITAYGYTKP